MLVSYNWLKTMVALPAEADDAVAFAERLDMTGTGVEGVETTGATFENIVLGQILTKDKHPNADTLWLTTVDVGEANLGEDGTRKPLQIVCGAQNFNAGDKVVVALAGAVLSDGTKIKKSKLRGVISEGMNCSTRELGLDLEADGIMILPKDVPVGTPFAKYHGAGDVIFDLEITPNRPDCMSMLGMAREIGAIYEAPLTYQTRELKEADTAEPVQDYVKVTIDDAEACPRYTARLIKNIKIGPSPDWLARRIVAAGARPINNIVDATNYIMFELGQPLHAFDFDKLTKDAEGKAHILIRKAQGGEPFTTLDGEDRVLTPDMTVIADANAFVGDTVLGVPNDLVGDAALGVPNDLAGNTALGVLNDTLLGKPVALAGVMGGLESEVDDNTVNILLESATFSTSSTSKTSRSLKLFSESSQRYERGVNADTCADFSASAAALIAEIAGGELCLGVVDEYPTPVTRRTLQFRVNRFNDFIGAEISAEDITAILTCLGCDIQEESAGTTVIAATRAKREGEQRSCSRNAGDLANNDQSLKVTVPTFRPDLEREVDLYEEVLRIWGMEKVPNTLAAGGEKTGYLRPELRRREQVVAALLALGLNETMTYSFASKDDVTNASLESLVQGLDVELLNPLSEEHGVLRRSILPGLLKSVAHNLNHGVNNVHLFEIGNIFFNVEDQEHPIEQEKLVGILVGSWNEVSWHEKARALDFFDGKGIVENLLRELAVKKVDFKAFSPEDAPWLQGGRAACIHGAKKYLGWIGEIHPKVAAGFDIDVPVVAFELDMALLGQVSNAVRPYKEIPQFPPVQFDIALLVDKKLTAKEVLRTIQSAGGTLLYDVKLFDIFEDAEKLGADKKSMAFSLEYRAADRTLTSEEVEKTHAKLLEKVTKATSATLR